MGLTVLSRSAPFIAISFAFAMLASFGFIGVASHGLDDRQFAEVAYVWLTVGAAPSMLALGNHLLLQRVAAHAGGSVRRRQLIDALVWPLGLLAIIAVVTAVAFATTGNRYAVLTLALVPALGAEVLRTVAGEAARVVVGPLRSIASGGQMRVIVTTLVLFGVRAAGLDWTAPVLIVTMTIVSLGLAMIAIRQCRLLSDPAQYAAEGSSTPNAGRSRLREMGALAAVSAVGVVFARTPVWASAVVAPGVLDEIAIGLTFYTLFSQPQAITNLALTADIAAAARERNRSRLRTLLGLATGLNSCLALVMLGLLVAFGKVGLELYAGERAEGLLGVVLLYSIAGSIVSVSGPGALILQLEGRDRSLVRLAVPSMVLAVIVFPLLATLDSASVVGVGLLIVTIPYNVAASWIAIGSRRASAGSGSPLGSVGSGGSESAPAGDLDGDRRDPIVLSPDVEKPLGPLASPLDH